MATMATMAGEQELIRTRPIWRGIYPAKLPPVLWLTPSLLSALSAVLILQLRALGNGDRNILGFATTQHLDC